MPVETEVSSAHGAEVIPCTVRATDWTDVTTDGNVPQHPATPLTTTQAGGDVLPGHGKRTGGRLPTDGSRTLWKKTPRATALGTAVMFN